MVLHECTWSALRCGHLAFQEKYVREGFRPILGGSVADLRFKLVGHRIKKKFAGKLPGVVR